MNSTWLSAHNEDRKQRVYDYGYLALGENQIFDAAHFLDERKPDLAIVVLHHPPGWLIEHDRNILFEQLGRRAHFLLHGHEHQQMAQISQGTHSDVMTIPAGACYKRRFEPDPRYVNSFNFVSVDLEAGTGSVFFQKWQEQAGAWRADDVLWPKGRFPFVLPTRSAENSPQQREAIHEVALFYRPFLKKRMQRDFVLHVKQTKHRSRAELVSLHMEYILEVERGGVWKIFRWT